MVEIHFLETSGSGLVMAVQVEAVDQQIHQWRAAGSGNTPPVSPPQGNNGGDGTTYLGSPLGSAGGGGGANCCWFKWWPWKW